MDALVNFYTDQSFLDWYKTTLDERHSWHFPKRNCCGHDDFINFGNTASHNYLVPISKSLWMAGSEM